MNFIELYAPLSAARPSTQCDSASQTQREQIKALRDALRMTRDALFIEDEVLARHGGPRQHTYAIEQADKVLHETKPKEATP